MHKGTARTYLPEHDDDLRVGEGPGFDVQLEGLPVQLPRLGRLPALRLRLMDGWMD